MSTGEFDEEILLMKLKLFSPKKFLPIKIIESLTRIIFAENKNF